MPLFMPTYLCSCTVAGVSMVQQGMGVLLLILMLVLSWGWLWVLWRKLKKKHQELDFRTGIMESANRMLGELLDERKDNEISLRQSQESYRLLVENQNDMIVKIDTQGHFLFVSPSYCRMFGKTQEELLGQTFLPLVHPEDRLSTEQAMKQLYVPPYTCYLEQRAMTAQGWKSIAWTDTAVLDNNGNVEAIIGVGRDITRQKEAELALRESESRWLLVLEGSGDGAWDWKIKTNEVFYSENWGEMLGYDAEAFENHYETWEKLVHPDDLPNAIRLIEEHLAGKSEKYQAEYRMKTRQGTWKWVLDKGKVVDYDDKGKPTRMVGTHSDISGIKKNQEELSTQNVFISTVLDNLPLGVAVNFMDSGQASYMNDKFAQIYGWSRKDLIDFDHFFTCIYPDEEYRKQMLERVQNDIASGDPARMRWDEIEITTSRGEKRFVSALNIPLPGQNMMVSTARDVTARVLHRRNLQNQHDQLKLLYDISRAIGTAQTYQEGLEYTLQQICETTGWQIGEVWEWDAPAEKLVLNPAFYAASEPLKGFRDASMKYRFSKGEGLPGMAFESKKPCWMFDIQNDKEFHRFEEAGLFQLRTGVGIPVLAADDVVNVMVFFTRETREEDQNLLRLFYGTGLQLGELFRRKQAEQQTLRLNAELEDRVELRTSQLQLANQELEAFTYSISHDLRAPLRAITGFAGILAADYANKLDKEGNRLLSVVKDNAAAMDKLITDLLAFSRMGKGDLNKTNLNMAEMATMAFEEVASEARHKFRFLLNEMPHAVADHALMLQVWRNLLSNAVKFTGLKDNPCIELGGKTVNNEIVYYVKDNGVGFEPHHAEKVFQVFKRLHPHDEFEGTGVGLAIVQRILLRHQGRIWVESNPGIGTCFRFSLPVIA